MTLVLSVATPAYSLQVSDRLVSKGGKPHDPLANKIVVLRAADGLLAFGYTGLAFIAGVPTDTWIGDSLSEGACTASMGSVAYGRFSVRDVGAGLRELIKGLQAQPRFQRSGGEITAVGWQWNGRRKRSLCRNVLWTLRSGSGRLEWQQVVPRHPPERKVVFRMVVTGQWPLTAGALQQLVNRVGAAGHDWELVEGLLVEAIRRSSALKPEAIGPHCMSIVLRPWMSPHVLVRFKPHSPHQALAFGEAVDVAYTPWMVARDAIHAPSVLVGGMTCEQGLLTYSMDAPPVPDDQTLKGLFHTQDRPRS